MAFLFPDNVGTAAGRNDYCYSGPAIEGDRGRECFFAGGDDEGAAGRAKYCTFEEMIFFAPTFFEYVFIILLINNQRFIY
jgi:hypothetical protein